MQHNAAFHLGLHYLPKYLLTLFLLVLSADNLCKQFGPRSGLTKRQTSSGFKLFDTLMVFLKEFSEKVDSEKKSADDKKAGKYFPGGKEFWGFQYTMS